MLDLVQCQEYEYVLLVRVQVSENVRKKILVCLTWSHSQGLALIALVCTSNSVLAAL